MALYTFFDVETPNRYNNRICSIATVVTDQHGTVVERTSHLVNPETDFDDINISIHGITPDETYGAKTFLELWEDDLHRHFLADGVVAHNAHFDLSVLSKTLAFYGIQIPKMPYACTLDMSRRVPGIESGRLPDVCKALGFRMSGHHQADSDADACMRIFWALVEQMGEFPRFTVYEPAPQGAKGRRSNR